MIVNVDIIISLCIRFDQEIHMPKGDEFKYHNTLHKVLGQ